MFRLIKRVRVQKGPVHLGHPVLSSEAIYLGWDRIYRIDAQELRTVWSRHHEGFAVSLVFGGVLFVGTGLALMALDLVSGETLWSRPFVGSLSWRGQVMTFEPDYALIIDPLTGEALDRMETPGRSTVHALDKDLLYTKGQANDVAAAYELTERTILWERPLLEETKTEYDAPGEVMSLVAGTRAIVLTKPDVGIFGCSKETGRILWYQKAFVSHYIPVVVDGRVYALTQGLPMRNDFAKFLCFDELTGERIYQTEHRELLGARPSRGTVFNDHIAFGNRDGNVSVFRLSDGELVWSHRTRGETWQPAYGHNRLYVTSDDGHLLVFEGKKSPTKTKTKTMSKAKIKDG